MSKSKKTANIKQLVDLEEIKKAAMALRGVNHKTRQAILNLLHDNKEMKVSDIYKKLKLEQSLTSAFLGRLRSSGVVKTRRDGQVIYYSVNYEHLSEIGKAVKIINS